MEDYNKIIESLGIRYIKSKQVKIVKPFKISNYYDVENQLILVEQGVCFFGPDSERISSGEILFVPGGKLLSIVYGEKNTNVISNEDFVTGKEKYFEPLHSGVIINSESIVISYINIEPKVFDTVNFFASLDIPAFKISGDQFIGKGIKEAILEQKSKSVGQHRMTKTITEQIIIDLIRYIVDNNLFVEKLATNVTYFKDPRLIDIFTYIKDHIEGDLSNQKLANVANVSEDYVGQYFKMLTGINPQDYIEYQRMELAVSKLRTTKLSIREIGRNVGYKDTAYFCRRFKMMFGIPAGKMRRRETLINL